MIAPDAKGQSTHSEMSNFATDRVSQGDHRFVYIAFVQRELFVHTPQVQGCRLRLHPPRQSERTSPRSLSSVFTKKFIS